MNLWETHHAQTGHHLTLSLLGDSCCRCGIWKQNGLLTSSLCLQRDPFWDPVNSLFHALSSAAVILLPALVCSLWMLVRVSGRAFPPLHVIYLGVNHRLLIPHICGIYITYYIIFHIYNIYYILSEAACGGY